MNRFLLVAAGGALGSLARYGVALSSHRLGAVGWPVSTLVVNILGSFLIALCWSWAMTTEWARLFIAFGILGGFTTYSAFNQDTLFYFESGQTGKALAYLALMLTSCLAAGFLGFAAGRRLTGL